MSVDDFTFSTYRFILINMIRNTSQKFWKLIFRTLILQASCGVLRLRQKSQRLVRESVVRCRCWCADFVVLPFAESYSRCPSIKFQNGQHASGKGNIPTPRENISQGICNLMCRLIQTKVRCLTLPFVTMHTVVEGPCYGRLTFASGA